MQSYGPAQVHGPQAINAPHRAYSTAGSVPSSRAAATDQLDISPEASFISRARELPDIVTTAWRAFAPPSPPAPTSPTTSSTSLSTACSTRSASKCVILTLRVRFFTGLPLGESHHHAKRGEYSETPRLHPASRDLQSTVVRASISLAGCSCPTISPSAPLTSRSPRRSGSRSTCRAAASGSPSSGGSWSTTSSSGTTISTPTS